MSFEAIISRNPPKRVYHYTDQAGLFGILDSGVLWATRIHCLNDHQEFRHGLEILRDAILKHPRTDPAPYASELVQAIDAVKAVNICISSWSERGDQLSQWRAYGKSRQGYALGLLSEYLKERATLTTGWKFGRCIYTGEEKRDLSQRVAENYWSALKDFQKKNPGDVTPAQLSFLFHMFVLPYASFFKHEGFSEEAEWRLVSDPLRRDDPRFFVRPGPNFPITFYKFPLLETGGQKIDAELIIGPGPSQELANHGAAVASVRSAHFHVHTRKPSLTPWRTDS